MLAATEAAKRSLIMVMVDVTSIARPFQTLKTRRGAKVKSFYVTFILKQFVVPMHTI